MKKSKIFTLLLILGTLLFYFSCSDNNDDDPPPTVVKPDPPPVYPDIEMAVFKAVNDHRISKGLDSLVMNDKIREIAREHSQNMASGKSTYSHEGFNERMEYIQQNVVWGNGAENLNAGILNAQECLNQWLFSTEHTQNLEGNYNLTGVGVSKVDTNYYYYFTQIYFNEQ